MLATPPGQCPALQGLSTPEPLNALIPPNALMLSDNPTQCSPLAAAVRAQVCLCWRSMSTQRRGAPRSMRTGWGARSPVTRTT